MPGKMLGSHTTKRTVLSAARTPAISNCTRPLVAVLTGTVTCARFTSPISDLSKILGGSSASALFLQQGKSRTTNGPYGCNRRRLCVASQLGKSLAVRDLLECCRGRPPSPANVGRAEVMTAARLSEHCGRRRTLVLECAERPLETNNVITLGRSRVVSDWKLG